MQRIASFQRRSEMAIAGFARRLAVVGMAVSLAACQLGGIGGTQSDVAAPSALQGPAVEVTTLGPIGAESPPDTAAPQAIAPAPTAPAKPKSVAHLACEKKGGKFVPLGKSGALTCQTPTRDGGKQCRKESDCEGLCLARSRTCAPAKPLFGCQSILQEDGVQVDLCLD